MDTVRLSPAYPLEIKRASVDAEGLFTGYGSTFDGPPDSYGDIIVKGAFKQVIADHKSAGTMPALLWAHDQSEPVGRWLDMGEDGHGLLMTGKLTLGTKRGAEASALLKDGALGLSIGFVLDRNGYERRDGIRYITKIARLLEVSLVAIPANSAAKVTGVKAKPANPRELEHLLRDAAGLSAREAKRVTAGGWGALAREERGSTNLDRVLSEIEELKHLILSVR